jgi:hypothetical protein
MRETQRAHDSGHWLWEVQTLVTGSAEEVQMDKPE